MLQKYLSKERDGIVAEWFECIVTGYAPQTAKFLRQQRDPFANPVGGGLRDELGPLYDGLVAGTDPEDLRPSLDQIIRVRAVQDLKPCDALGFLFDLKRIVRNRVEAEHLGCEPELVSFNDRVDRLVLKAIDVFAACREQVFEIRVKQIRKLSLDRMERLNEWRTNREKVGGPGATEPH